MTEIFEFFFKYRPLVYQKGAFAFQAPWPAALTWVLLAAAIVLSWLLYRQTAAVFTPRWRALFLLLRAVPLLLLIFIFLQPVLLLKSVIPQKGHVAIAYDVSKSMEIEDGPGGESRLDQVRNLLTPGMHPFLDELGRKFQLRFFRFSGQAERVAGFEDLPRRGNITSIEQVLNRVAEEMSDVSLAGIVLVTDGADNRSTGLAAAAARLRAANTPVYPVGVGAGSLPRDAEILRVTGPRKVLKDSLIEADVTIRSRGYAGRKARLQVLAGSRPLQSTEITLGSDGEVKTHKVHFTGDAAGARIFTFRLDPLGGEVVTQNNENNMLVRIEDEQPAILYVEGEPRWVYAFIRRAAEEDRNLQLTTLLRQADGKFLRQGVEDASVLAKGFPLEKAELFRYKAIIVGSVEASFFSFDQMRLISDFVSRRGGGFLMLGGRNSFGQGGYLNTPLEDVLPVNLRDAGGTGNAGWRELEYKVRLGSYGKVHPVTRLSMDEDENAKRWGSAPALVGINPTAGVKPGATVLLEGILPDAQGTGPAVLAFQRYGRGRAMALLTGSTWRWRMEQDHRDNFHELFWRQMLRWLVNEVPDALALETERHSYSLEETVLLRAEANDASFIPLNNAQVNARVKSPSGQIAGVPLSWSVEREGIYQGRFKPLEDGIHEVSVDFDFGSRSLGTARTTFRVAESGEEFRDAAQNTRLLSQLAGDTGGRYYTLAQARHLPEDISYVESGVAQVETRDLWDMPAVFILIAAAVSAEWILRKRKGLA